MIAAHPAQAQSETVLYNFYDDYIGANPSGLTSDGAGNLYGATYMGGTFGYGTVFKLSPKAAGGWNLTSLHNFAGGTDGRNPWCNVIFDSAGNLYGTAFYGGANENGVVFELSPAGKGWTENILYTFASDGNGDGANPVDGLIMDANGNLYGTTYNGGDTSVPGTVFELSRSAGVWKEQVIYDIAGGAGYAGLTIDAAGNIFGAGASTAFELSPNGQGGWNPSVIHSFYPCVLYSHAKGDGSCAYGTPVFDRSGNLYGTTYSGGAEGYGTVYKLSPGKKGRWSEKIVHSFRGPEKDGSNPFSGITFDARGNIYGTTASGGGRDEGTAFELRAPVGEGYYKEKVLWSFNGVDGYAPYATLILDAAGNLYGTTFGLSQYGGNVFEITP
jgi:uncharacterized repeat protein (TIGR03803 family)